MPNIFKFKGFQCEIPALVIWAGSIIFLILGSMHGYLKYVHEDVVKVFVEVQDPTQATITTESRKHWQDEPTEEFTLDDGRKIVRHFGNTDHCISIDKVIDEVTTEVLAFITDEPDQMTMLFTLLAEPAFAGEKKCNPDECSPYLESCEEIEGDHGGRFRQYKEEDPDNKCIVWLHRIYDDCCHQRERVDVCSQNWSEDTEIEWVCCMH